MPKHPDGSSFSSEASLGDVYPLLPDGRTTERMLPPIPAAVDAYCARHGVRDDLLQLLGFVAECFPTQRGVPLLSVVHDEDSGDAWISVEILVDGEVEQVSEWYDRYSDMRLSLPRRARRHVRLAHYVV